MTTRPEIAVGRRFSDIFALALLMLMLAACAVNVTYRGLRPVYPAYPDTYHWNCGNPYDYVVVDVDSLQPSLEWETFPRQRYLSINEGKQVGHISNVTYELKISEAASEPVYERKGLTTPQHRIETPLQPSSKYRWSVRAHFDLDGHPRVTGWGEMRIDIHAKDFVPRYLPYSFKTPESK